MNKNILFVIALISITLFSCQKENELTSLSNSSNEINEESLSSEFDENHYLTSLAQILNNAAMQDINVLKYLQEEASNQIDGDFNILLAKIFNETKSSNPVLLRMQDQFESNFHDSIIDDFKKNAPLLNIYLPYDRIITESDEFLTIILPSSFDDKIDTIVKAFNQKGELIELSTESEPEILYMVIGYNERLTLTPETEFTRSTTSPVFSNELNSYYLPDNFNQTVERSFIPATFGVKRNNRSEPDVISRAKFKSSDAIKEVEKWLRGAPEVHLTVIYADYSISDLILGPLLHNLQFNMGDNGWYSGPRRKKNPCDNYGNWNTTNWVNCQKTYMKYHFHEKDNKFKVTINGWEVEFSGGDLIGDCKVNYSDDLGTTYHMGSMFEIDIN